MQTNFDIPFKNIIGGARGASLSGGGFYSKKTGNRGGRYLVLEIPEDEFKYNAIHRYSVIPHEYFHAFQTSLSINFYKSF